MKFVGHVSGSYEQIIWVLICQDHVIGRSRDYDIIIAFFLRRELRWAWKLSVNENLVKNLLTLWERLRRNTGENENILAP